MVSVMVNMADFIWNISNGVKYIIDHLNHMDFELDGLKAILYSRGGEKLK